MNILIILALVFITGVMVFLMFQGVHLKERRMVKWSSIRSVDEGTEKIANFFFPILKEWDVVSFDGDSKELPKIYKSFLKRAKEIAPNTKIVRQSEAVNPKTFRIHVRSLDSKKAKQECQQNDRVGCVILKAINKYQKETRDPQKKWISLYRINETEVLFLVK